MLAISMLAKVSISKVIISHAAIFQVLFDTEHSNTRGSVTLMHWDDIWQHSSDKRKTSRIFIQYTWQVYDNITSKDKGPERESKR